MTGTSARSESSQAAPSLVPETASNSLDFLSLHGHCRPGDSLKWIGRTLGPKAPDPRVLRAAGSPTWLYRRLPPIAGDETESPRPCSQLPAPFHSLLQEALDDPPRVLNAALQQAAGSSAGATASEAVAQKPSALRRLRPPLSRR